MKTTVYATEKAKEKYESKEIEKKKNTTHCPQCEIKEFIKNKTKLKEIKTV